MSRKVQALEALRRLHEEIDRRSAVLTRSHAGRVRCERGCAGCCGDGLSVFDLEAERIRRSHAELLDSGLPHPVGACAFLDERGGCRIYETRPYVCRTQGLPLRWIDEDASGRPVELRDICPLNEMPGPPVEKLDQELCWLLGPYEGRLAHLQRLYGTGTLRRVELRRLFRRRETAQGVAK